MASGVVVYPLDTLKHRMMAADLAVWGETCSSSLKMLQYMINKEGVGSLYLGLSPFLLKQVLAFQLHHALWLARPSLHRQ